MATITIPHYMPAYRVFQLYPLDSGCRYRVFITCQDKDGEVFRSNTVTATTGIKGKLSLKWGNLQTFVASFAKLSSSRQLQLQLN